MKKTILTILIIIGLFHSCDKDFNTIGSEILDNGNYQFEKYPVDFIKAYSRPTGPVQSNNLPLNALGVYNDPTFGTTIANFVTELELQTTTPNFGFDAVIQSNDSVYLYVPYFIKANQTEIDDDGNRTYVLDSIHGNVDQTMNLRIFHSNFFIREFDLNDPTVPQKYYSNQKGIVESNLGMQLNSAAPSSENTAFKFSKSEIIIYKTDGDGNYVDDDGNVVQEADKVVKSRMEPGMWINLDKSFFFNNVINTSASNLINNTQFRNHLRGIYFQMEENVANQGAMAMLDFSRAYINIQYHSKDEDIADAELKKKNFRLNLKGKTINFFTNNFSIPNGEEELYLKGGDGSVAYINLFGEDADVNGVADELETLRNEGILINDAVLTFTIKQPLAGKEPRRIYVFDATNNAPILDYITDVSTTLSPKNNKFLFGGFIEVDENKDGIRYRIRITSHINRIIKGDNPETNKNIVIGLSLTDNINSALSYSLQNPVSIPLEVPVSTSATFNNVPQSSIITPLGTVLYGNHTNVPLDSRLKLEIYYTKPNSN